MGNDPAPRGCAKRGSRFAMERRRAGARRPGVRSACTCTMFLCGRLPCEHGAGVAEPVLDVDKVLLAIEELRRWEQRALEMSKGGARVTPEETARVRQQIAYYSGLLQDMKRRANPDSAPRLMRRIG